MAKRFFAEFDNLLNVRYNVEIWDADFSGTATEFKTGADGFRLSYEGDNNQRTGPIFATQCEVTMLMQDTTQEALITDIISSAEGRFTLRITQGPTSPTLFWVGSMLADIGSYEEAYYPYGLNLRATDGIGTLKDIEYKGDVDYYAGKETLVQHLINALTHINFVPVHYAATQRFVRVAVDWWEETMTNSTSNDPLALAYLDHSVWFVYEKDVKRARNCYEVLENILRVFGARITMMDGVFWVEQITYRTAVTIVLRSYDVDGDYLSSNNFSNLNTINQTELGALLATGTYEFFAPLSKVQHDFNVRLRQNFIVGLGLSSGNTGLNTINRPIHANNGLTTLRLTGVINLTLFNSSYAVGEPTMPRFAMFRGVLKIGSYYLKRAFTVSNFQVNYGTMSWETSAEYFYIAVSMPNGVPPNAHPSPYNYSQQIEVMTPPLPTGADDFQIQLIWESITEATLGSFLSSFNFLNQWLEPFSYGNPALSDDTWEYEALNPDAGNTLIHQSESLIGNSTDPNASGAIWVEGGPTGFQLAGDWGDGVDTPDRPLEQLLVELILGGQRTPIRRLSGGLTGTIEALARVSWLGEYWLLQRGTWIANTAVLDGTWFEFNYDGAGLTTSGPIKIKKNNGEPGTTFPPSPPHSGDTGLAAYEMQTALPGTLLYPVAHTRVDGLLAAGAITSLLVVDTLADNDFNAGDTIAILDPVTGIFEELEVTVTSVDFDTTIAVTGTLTRNYPNLSPVLKKPLIGVTGAPPSTVTPSALTRTNDTNVTVTLGGTPATALLQAVSLTLGWTGVLAIARGGTGLSTLGTALQLIRVNAGATALEYFTPTFLTSAITTANNGLTLTSSNVQLGGPLVQHTNINQAGFRLETRNGRLTVFRQNLDIYSLASVQETLGVTGLSANINKTSTPSEDSVFAVRGYNTTTSALMANGLFVGVSPTASAGTWLQSRSQADYSVFYPLAIQPGGGKAVFGNEAAFNAMFSFNASLSAPNGTLDRALMYLRNPNSTDGAALIAFGVGGNTSYRGAVGYFVSDDSLRLYNNNGAGASSIRFGFSESADKVIILPTGDGRMGVGYAATASIHSTLQSAGSLSAAILSTAGAPTFDETKHTVYYNVTANVTWTLPDPATCVGRMYILHHSSTAGTITLSRNISKGNGGTFNTLTAGQWAFIQADSGNWRGYKIASL